MKYYKFLYFILFSFIFNFSIISQNNPKEILNVINDGQEEVILYDDKSWEFASVVTRKNILKTFPTAMPFAVINNLRMWRTDHRTKIARQILNCSEKMELRSSSSGTSNC